MNEEGALKYLNANFPKGEAFSKRDISRESCWVVYCLDILITQGKVISLGKGLFKVTETKPVYHYEV
jgi:hypothetical protein